MRKTALACLVSAVIVAVAAQSHACSCAHPDPPLEALAASDAVFTGRVVAIDGDESYAYRLRVSFAVQACWKGAETSTVLVFTADNDAACGFPFLLGGEYIVYASHANDALHTNLCTRTRPLAFAAEDLDALGDPACPVGVEPSTWSLMKLRYRD